MKKKAIILLLMLVPLITFACGGWSEHYINTMKVQGILISGNILFGIFMAYVISRYFFFDRFNDRSM